MSTLAASGSNDALGTRRRRLAFGALAAVHLAVLFVGPLLTDEAGLIPINRQSISWLDAIFPPHWLLGAVAIIGVWIVLGSGRWYVRMGIGTLGWMWLGMALVLGELLTPNWPYAMSSWLLAAALAALASVLITAAAQWLLAWRLTLNGVPFADTGRRFQFRLAHLVAAVTLIAVTLGLARLLNQRFVHFTVSYFLLPEFVLDWLWRAAVEFWCPALVAVGTVVFTLGQRQRVLWIVPLFLVLTALDAAAHYGLFTYRNWRGFEFFTELYPRFLGERFVADGAIMLSLLVTTGVLRTLGYRIGPAPNATSDRPPTPAK